jgi:hypothetical protein
MRTILVLALAVGLGSHAAAAQPGTTANPCVVEGNANPRLLPADQAPSMPDFVRYRARLRMAVERRDVNAVVELMDPDIKLGFDDSSGVGMFRTTVAEYPQIWEELRTALALGGGYRSEDVFEAPYVFALWPTDFNSFECGAIVGRNVRMRSAPRTDAPILAALSYSIVRINVEKAVKEWMHVELADGRTGYIAERYVRSPIDYRALFNLIDGRWRMTAFVAGD